MFTHRTRVLVVDDEKDFAESVREYLTDNDCTVSVASTIDEAMREISRFHPEIVLCDLRMPGGSGILLLRAIRALGEDIRVIMMSAHPDLDARDVFLFADADLRKPFQLEDLLATIRRCAQPRAAAS